MAQKSPLAPKEDAKPVSQERIDTLSDAQWKERSFDLDKLYSISQVRESPQPQFDGMGYMKYNETNEMADMSYIPPKKNKMDSRLVTGTTHEKDSSLLSMMSNFNFEGTIRIFRGSEEQTDLGTAMTAWVRASREAEFYDRKRPVNYRNMLVQGTSFVQESFIERFMPKKVVDLDTVDFSKLDQVDWVNAGLELLSSGCESGLVDGKKVFMENIRENDIQQQPGVYLVEYVPREVIRSGWGASKRWNDVPKSCSGPMGSVGYITQGSIYSDWTFAEVDENKIEVIQVFRRFENRYQVYLNGIPMLPVGFPLTAISPSGLVPIAKGDLDQMNLFAYSKSIPAKTKVDQAVFDEIIRLMLIKFQQSAFVPRVNNTDMILTQNILMPGKMNQGFKATDVAPLIDNPGITASDFSFYQLFKTQLDDKSISAILEGNTGTDQMTLGQYMDMQKKQMLKLGSIFDAVINWERQMLQLRVMNLIANGARPVGDIRDASFRDVVVDDSFGDAKGTRVIKFQKGITKTSDDVFNEQEGIKRQTGNEVRISYIDPVQLRALLSDKSYSFVYEIVPVDKNNDKLSQAFFVSTIAQAAELFGPQSLNVDTLKKRYASVFNEEFDTLFLDSQTVQANQQRQQMSQMKQDDPLVTQKNNPNGPLAPVPTAQPGPTAQPNASAMASNMFGK